MKVAYFDIASQFLGNFEREICDRYDQQFCFGHTTPDYPKAVHVETNATT